MSKILTVLFLSVALIGAASAQEGDSIFNKSWEGDSLSVSTWDVDTIPELNPNNRARPDSMYIAEADSLYRVKADSLYRLDADSIALAEPDFSHSPTKAIMYALVLPGLGQSYNKKYWKIPIVWGAIGGAAYAINFNTGQYQRASEIYAEDQSSFFENQLRYWRRNMELSYIALLAVYALQVIDAYVDAHLFNWDVNENLSIRWTPSLQPLMTPVGGAGNLYGLSCSINLKR